VLITGEVRVLLVSVAVAASFVVSDVLSTFSNARFVLAVVTFHKSERLLAISNAHVKLQPDTPQPIPPNLLVF
tara:strand:+ start:923 stop:1141 length:219 start_codon:yes stop_codon:yes gene_type:complete